MTWRTVVLTKNSNINLRLNHLVVKTETVTKIPLVEIGQLVIENPNIIMTGHILNALSKHKIMTVICDEKHLPFSQLNLIYGNFRSTKIMQAQLNWQKLRKEQLWKIIIQQKIRNQHAVLKKFFPEEEFQHMDKYFNDVQLGDCTNREGHAAKFYFNRLFGMHFIRGTDTALNWGLNYVLEQCNFR